MTIYDSIDYESLGKNLVAYCVDNNIKIEEVFSILNGQGIYSFNLTDDFEDKWQQKIKEYCDYYNIPLQYLAETMHEPKVVPMIRGKAFEFSIMTMLQTILPKDEWLVDKIMVNAQSSLHDIDVQVLHIPSHKKLTVECKLASKERYRYKNECSEIKIKCMRSRTLGESRVAALAPKLGISKDVLMIHNDQYLPEDFDLVITSIGNAFYRTDEATGRFEWRPTKREIEFLEGLSGHKSVNLKNFAFNKVYVARSKDLAIGSVNGVNCTRKKCKDKSACGFIPNYPVIGFNSVTGKPKETWVEIEDSLSLFQSLIHQETSTEKRQDLGEAFVPGDEPPIQTSMF